MMSWAANAEGDGFGAGDGIACAVTLTVANAPGMSCPGGGKVVTEYCDAPAPVGPLIDHEKLAIPSFRTMNDCSPGAAPPHVAENESDEGVIVGPPPSPFPESAMDAGSAPQTDPVAAVIVMLPVTSLAETGENDADTACAAPGSRVNAEGDTLKGEDASVGPPPDTVSATVAGALPVLTTSKYCVADSSSWTEPKLPKFGVTDVLKARIAPLGCSVRRITCAEVSTSVSIVSVPVIGVTGELAGTGGASTARVTVKFAGIARPTLTLAENPGAPASETVVTDAFTTVEFVSMSV
jgi:hypothetical protein